MIYYRTGMFSHLLDCHNFGNACIRKFCRDQVCGVNRCALYALRYHHRSKESGEIVRSIEVDDGFMAIVSNVRPRVVNNKEKKCQKQKQN